MTGLAAEASLAETRRAATLQRRWKAAMLGMRYKID